MTNSLLLKMAIEIVDLPIEHGDFSHQFFVCLPENNQELTMARMTNKFNDEPRRNMGGAEINHFSVSKPRLSRQ